MSGFVARLECRNCGNTWPHILHHGDRLLNEDWSGGPYLRSAECTHNHSCTACMRLKCPNCGLHEDVRVLSRQPS